MRPIGGELVTTITSPSCWGTHFLFCISATPPSGNLLPIIPCSFPSLTFCPVCKGGVCWVTWESVEGKVLRPPAGPELVACLDPGEVLRVGLQGGQGVLYINLQETNIS